MLKLMVPYRQEARSRQARWRLPRPRRFTVVLGLIASVGVAMTSLRAAPLGLLIPVTIAWLSAFAAGGLWARGGPAILTGLAAVVKAMTVALIVWAITHPQSPIGPRGALDWIPLGSLNAATGIWLLRVIRHQVQ
jgi:hypothetical protein